MMHAVKTDIDKIKAYVRYLQEIIRNNPNATYKDAIHITTIAEAPYANEPKGYDSVTTKQLEWEKRIEEIRAYYKADGIVEKKASQAPVSRQAIEQIKPETHSDLNTFKVHGEIDHSKDYIISFDPAVLKADRSSLDAKSFLDEIALQDKITAQAEYEKALDEERALHIEQKNRLKSDIFDVFKKDMQIYVNMAIKGEQPNSREAQEILRFIRTAILEKLL
jgi:thymidylate synthase